MLRETKGRVSLPRTAPARGARTRNNLSSPNTGSAFNAGFERSIVDDTLRSHQGEQLQPDLQSYFGSRFGHDFGKVRIHADDRAGASATHIGARAYTKGEDIVFAPGQFAPHTFSGLGLMAHELTHVVQQRGRSPELRRKPVGKGPDDDAEKDANDAANKVGAPSNDVASNPEISAAVDKIRQEDHRPGPRIPITPDLLALFSRPAVGKPSLPKQFKDATYQEIKGRAFVKGATATEDVDINDVRQGQLGDCGLHAAMAAIAKVNPQAIRDLIKENPDGSYDVTIYFKDHVWNNKSPHVIKVQPLFPVDKSGKPLFSQEGDVGPNGPELWAMLIEKAYAMHAGGYDDISGISPKDAMELLSKETGAEEHGTEDLPEDKMGKEINEKVSSGKYAVTASTNLRNISKLLMSAAEEAQAKALGIVFDHAYTILKVDEAAKTLDLRNPWGHNHLFGLPFAAFRKFFSTWEALKVKP